uniref:NADH dehydrogenase subunit 5 n=1 Tax=Haltichella nipponensis TaxID=2907788 RepID=UPI001EDEE0F5|nr:NADH dehydrogenase subunit 5 [Haltichella nipponensis]UIB40569.1 NADH dehydrogenase subunit 5 [Haltichella nipponensis]
MIYYYLWSMYLLLFSLLMLLISIFFYFLNFSMMIYWNFLVINSLEFNLLMFFDWMTLMFIFIVFFISSMIMIYCVDYMIYEYNKNMFLMLMIFFIFSMMMLVISPNLMSILLGWDGLGLISFILVIYYQNNFSMNSGMLTVLLNRIGDTLILMSIGWFSIMGSWNFMNFMKLDSLIMLMMIVLAAFTKSAQFPFSSWLPAAMAAPTPVSSLVHSSTLVTAGVYLLIRFNWFIFKNEIILIYIFYISVITMMFASLSAIIEYDMKKIVAFSTLSQLSFMFIMYSFKNIDLVFFHLIIHALFKSVMFMSCGSMIHAMSGIQDIRFMGYMFNYMPLTSMILMISMFSLCGIPFFSGFYSKDQIIECSYLLSNCAYLFIFYFFSVLLTFIYSFRLFYYLNLKKFSYMNMIVFSESKNMSISMFMLMFLTLFFGLMMNYLIFMKIEIYFIEIFEKLLVYSFYLLILNLMLIILNKCINLHNKFFNYFFYSMWLLNKLIKSHKFIFKNSINLWISMDKNWNEVYKVSIFLLIKKLKNLNFVLNNWVLELLLILIIYILIF